MLCHLVLAWFSFGFYSVLIRHSVSNRPTLAPFCRRPGLVFVALQYHPRFVIALCSSHFFSSPSLAPGLMPFHPVFHEALTPPHSHTVFLKPSAHSHPIHILCSWRARTMSIPYAFRSPSRFFPSAPPLHSASIRFSPRALPMLMSQLPRPQINATPFSCNFHPTPATSSCGSHLILMLLRYPSPPLPTPFLFRGVSIIAPCSFHAHSIFRILLLYFESSLMRYPLLFHPTLTPCSFHAKPVPIPCPRHAPPMHTPCSLHAQLLFTPYQAMLMSF